MRETLSNVARRGTLLVLTQFVLIALLAGSVAGAWASGTAPSPGAVIAISAGVLLGLWALVAMRASKFSVMPLPRAGATLVTAGPYRILRHPMYTAVLMVGAGFALDAASALSWITWLMLGLCLILKIRMEEHLLAERFAGYASYQARTARLMPGIW